MCMYVDIYFIYLLFLCQINRLTEDLRQNAPLDGNVYIAPEYHQAPHHYLRVRQENITFPPDILLIIIIFVR